MATVSLLPSRVRIRRPFASRAVERFLTCIPRLLPPCYHAGVTSAKKQTQVRLEEDVLTAGKAAAAAVGRRLSVEIDEIKKASKSSAKA